jgi:NADH:ubiquinone oxidoreductase subunit 2 (subunit N)
VIGAYYYLRIVYYMYFGEETVGRPVAADPAFLIAPA